LDKSKPCGKEKRKQASSAGYSKPREEEDLKKRRKQGVCEENE
jgi:hypothetical protein